MQGTHMDVASCHLIASLAILRTHPHFPLEDAHVSHQRTDILLSYSMTEECNRNKSVNNIMLSLPPPLLTAPPNTLKYLLQEKWHLMDFVCQGLSETFALGQPMDVSAPLTAYPNTA